MSNPEFDINKISEALNGTCEHVDNIISSIYGDEYDATHLTQEQAEDIDELVFCCETCSWWHEACEQDGSGNCENCSSEGKCGECGCDCDPDELNEDGLCESCE